MQFTTLALAAIAVFSTSVSAHGRLIDPVGLKHTGSQAFLQDIRVPANGCGDGVTVAGASVLTLKAGAIGNLTWTVDNGDGAGPLGVFFDTTGKGTAFSTTAKMIQNVAGSNGGVANDFPRGAKDISFTVPNVKCTGCVMQVRQVLTGKDGFGSCAVVDIV